VSAPCASCHVRCCFAYVVPVTGFDAWRIATELQIGLDQFLVAIPANEQQPTAFRLDLSGRFHAIALDKQEDDGEHDGDRACIFWYPLLEGYGRCGVYAVRPNVCRTYPAYLRDGAVHLRQDVVCPPRSWSLASLNLPAWRRNLLLGQLHDEAYASVVGAWNDHVGETGTSYGLAAYYGYLTATYRELAPRWDDVDDAMLQDAAVQAPLLASVREEAGAALAGGH
jgi:Fe-S-cluster containining protein